MTPGHDAGLGSHAGGGDDLDEQDVLSVAACASRPGPTVGDRGDRVIALSLCIDEVDGEGHRATGGITRNSCGTLPRNSTLRPRGSGSARGALAPPIARVLCDGFDHGPSAAAHHLRLDGHPCLAAVGLADVEQHLW